MHFQPQSLCCISSSRETTITCTAVVHPFQLPWHQQNTVGVIDQLKQYHLYEEGRRGCVFSNRHFQCALGSCASSLMDTLAARKQQETILHLRCYIYVDPAIGFADKRVVQREQGLFFKEGRPGFYRHKNFLKGFSTYLKMF